MSISILDLDPAVDSGCDDIITGVVSVLEWPPFTMVEVKIVVFLGEYDRDQCFCLPFNRVCSPIHRQKNQNVVCSSFVPCPFDSSLSRRRHQ